MNRSDRAAGFSLIELLVASACMTLVAGAVFSLLVGAATISRREWSALAARRLAHAAVTAVARDLGMAGEGLEDADAVQLGGERIAFASADQPGQLRLVLALGPAREIVRHEAGSRYALAAGGALRTGDVVAAVGCPDRPAVEPLPVGTVTAVLRGAAHIEVMVAWRFPEAVAVSAWGEPRALLPVIVREYTTRAVDGAHQLVRRDDGGSRQPVADGLDGFALEWLVDTDADGRVDARRATVTPAAATRLCAARVVASARPLPARLADVLGEGLPTAAPLERAERWVTLSGCAVR